MLYNPLAKCLWPGQSRPDINTAVTCFLAPAGFIYALSFGFTFQQAFEKHRGVLQKVSTSDSFDWCDAFGFFRSLTSSACSTNSQRWPQKWIFRRRVTSERFCAASRPKLCSWRWSFKRGKSAHSSRGRRRISTVKCSYTFTALSQNCRVLVYKLVIVLYVHVSQVYEQNCSRINTSFYLAI